MIRKLLKAWWAGWFVGKRVPPMPPLELEPAAPRRKALKVPAGAAALSAVGGPKPMTKAATARALRQWAARATPPAGVVPGGGELAMDALPALTPEALAMAGGYLDTDLVFPGYPILAMMSQRAEYRMVVGCYSREMTRMWIEFTGAAADGQEDKSRKDRIAKIDAAFRRLRIRELIGDMIDDDGYFGRSHLYIDLGKPASDNLPLPRTKNGIAQGSLKGIRKIDPMWCYPAVVGQTDPRSPTFYRPDKWYVNGQTVHIDRLLTLTMSPVPDVIKPLYMYGGLSRTQMIKPYIDNWLRDRQSVSDAVNAHAVWKIKTNMESFLAGDETAAGDLYNRIDVFNNLRSNRGAAVLDMNDEDISVEQQSLAGLSDLQAQSREHIAGFAGVPLVIMFPGTSPAGLNASSDGEVRSWYDRIMAEQEKDLRPIIQAIFEIVQLNEFGDIDEALSFRFVPLYQLTEKEKAEVRKLDAEADQILTGAQILAPEDARERLSKDETSKYHGIALSEPPEPEIPEGTGPDGEIDDEKDEAA